MKKPFYENPKIYDLYHPEKANELLMEYYGNIFKGKDIKTIYDCSFGTGN